MLSSFFNQLTQQVIVNPKFILKGSTVYTIVCAESDSDVNDDGTDSDSSVG